MRATLSLLGMYKYNPSVLDLLEVPSGINKEHVEDELLIRSANLEIAYPEPEYCKEVIGLFCARRLPIWEKLYATTMYEYNAIENYDRIEERSLNEDESKNNDIERHNTSTQQDSRNTTESEDIKETNDEERSSRGTATETSSRTGNSSGTSSDTADKSGTTNTDKSAYNNNTYVPVDLVTTSEHSTADRSTSARSSEDGTADTRTTDSGSLSGVRDISRDREIKDTGSLNVNANDSESSTSQRGRSEKETTRTHGNIGVTTTQQMIQQEREIVQFDIIDYIVTDIIGAICILVY